MFKDNYNMFSKENMDRFKNEISNRLPKSFVNMYYKGGWLHDWDLVSFSLSNVGTTVQHYSKLFTHTIDMMFCHADYYILLSYINVSELTVKYKNRPSGGGILTGLGCCIINRFDVHEDSSLSHKYEFEYGTMYIRFEKLKYKRIYMEYWSKPKLNG